MTLPLSFRKFNILIISKIIINFALIVLIYFTMAISKCSKCDCTRFELKEANISGSAYRMYFVQCSSCGAVVGVVPFINTAALIQQLADKMNIKLQ